MEWSVKNILWYARTHGFTPNVNYALLMNNKFNSEQLILENKSRRIKRDHKVSQIEENDEKIDVIDCENGIFIFSVQFFIHSW